MSSLNKEIANRLRAGALVVLVEEPDEALALAAAKLAAKQFQPVKVVSAASQSLMDDLEKHKSAEGTLILLDFLRAFGSNPVAARFVREVALQLRPQERPEDKVPFSRLILLESPGVQIPEVLRGDIEYLLPKMPEVAELREELDGFMESQQVPTKGLDVNEIAAALAGLSRHEAHRLFARCWIEKGKLDPIWLRKEKALRVSERLGGALTFVEADVPDVGGLGGLKKWLDARKGAFNSDKAKQYGLPEPKGILLLGIPGTGKSLTAKTIAKLWGLPLLRLDAGKLFGSLVGQSESQTRQAINSAEASSPCILWLDEIEKAFAGARGGGDSGTSQRVFGAFLTWLQEKVKPVFVVATANDISGLPPELLRKGRFDEIFFVDLPTPEEREEIAAIHLKRHGRDPKKISPAQIAAVTDGFSGAEIEQAIIEAMFMSFGEQRDVNLADIQAAIKGTHPLSKTMEGQIKALRGWAEGRAKKAALPAEEEKPTKEGRVRRPVAA